MTQLDVDTAPDALLSHFYSYWKDNTPAVNGGVVPDVEWPNDENLGTPLNQGNVPWARVTVKHLSRSLRSIGSKLYQQNGQIMVQVFAPGGKQGLAVASALGKVALDAFEGKHDGSGELWFRDATYREVGQDGPWYQANVTAGFTYDVVK